jgi:16S rRNA (uracil1498-N3)-methyltransferase
MQRYVVNDVFSENLLLTIVGEDAKHIQKVMRMQPGQMILVVSKGQAFESEIVSFNGHDVNVKRVSGPLSSNELPKKVTICCGLPKGEKLDLITQKGTELGMFELVLFEAERSIVKWDIQKGRKKQERLQKIAKEAAEQSHRTIVPVIHQLLSFKQMLELSSKYDVLFVADEEDAKQQTRTRFADQIIKANDKDSICIVFGPEGGLSRTEIQKLHEKGFQSISLGPRILRAETAPMYVLSAISYEFE